MGKHVDETLVQDLPPDESNLRRLHRLIMGRPCPAHRADRTPLTVEIDREVWTPGEVPPNVTPTWHDAWSGDPETDKAWAHEDYYD